VLLHQAGDREQRLRSLRRRAAFTARSTSSTLEIGALASSSPVAGLSTDSVSPRPGADSPSMKLLSVWVVLAIVSLLVYGQAPSAFATAS
jgi:hypothetical protein